MNAQEAATLCRAVKSVCPQQKFDQFTPDFWQPLLADIDFQDAKRALIEVAKRQPFVSPAEIRAEVAASKRRMVAAIPPVTPPWQLEDGAPEQRWIADYRHAIADGLPEQQARLRANYLAGITDEPLAIEASEEVREQAAAIKAQMEESMRETVRKQSLREADTRVKAAEKKARYDAIRAAELTAKEEAAKKEHRDMNDVIASHIESNGDAA